jgi:aspartate kinase
MRLVIKFGGTSVGNPDAIRQAAAIAHGLRQDGQEVIVVTSAMSGVTDLLLARRPSSTSRQGRGTP